MRVEILVGTLISVATAGCSQSAHRLTTSTNMGDYVRQRSGGQPSGDPAAVHFQPKLCDGEELRPEYARLDEFALVRFLKRQRIDVQIERPRADLVYVSLAGVGTARTVRLRVAILNSADEAGRELHEAILQHGPGAWGVHRANLAVLGPVGSISEDMTFAAFTKLACWGVFTVASTDDTFVVPGAYTEL